MNISFSFVLLLILTGAGLCNYVTDLLQKLNLSIHDLRGQGYDNCTNMRGVHSGLQTRILNINPRACFVPCSAHSLNLVVNDAAKISFEVSGFFDIVQEMYLFFFCINEKMVNFKNVHFRFNIKTTI